MKKILILSLLSVICFGGDVRAANFSQTEVFINSGDTEANLRRLQSIDRPVRMLNITGPACEPEVIDALIGLLEQNQSIECLQIGDYEGRITEGACRRIFWALRTQPTIVDCYFPGVNNELNQQFYTERYEIYRRLQNIQSLRSQNAQLEQQIARHIGDIEQSRATINQNNKQIESDLSAIDAIANSFLAQEPPKKRKA